MSDIDHGVVMREINTRIHLENDWSLIRNQEDSRWFLHLVTDLALALWDQEIVYLDTRVTYEEDDSFAIQVLIFTAGLIIVADVNGKLSSPDVDRTVRVRSRSGLDRVAVRGSAAAFSQNFASEWPGRVMVTLDYESGERFELPLSHREHEAKSTELRNLLDASRLELAAKTS